MLKWIRSGKPQLTVKSASAPEKIEPKAAPLWSARMWYRFLTYQEGNNFLSIDVDVMAEGPDIVLVPSEIAWRRQAPEFCRDRREEIILRTKSVKWNRQLEWLEGDFPCSLRDPAKDAVPGSIESTEGGNFLEHLGLFNPGASVSFAQARTLWTDIEVRFAASATGRVTLFVSKAAPNSMLNRISLPALRRNPNVTLDFR